MEQYTKANKETQSNMGEDHSPYKLGVSIFHANTTAIPGRLNGVPIVMIKKDSGMLECPRKTEL